MGNSVHIKLAILFGSIAGGLLAVVLVPLLTDWIPYDYAVYVHGARLVREGFDPHALLPYWYPLPVTLFTTMLWSFLPDSFAWAFAFIPLGLLHLRYGRLTPLTWLFFPLLINVMYAQAEGWLLFPIFWLLEDARIRSSVGMLALIFKPAYGIVLVPYRLLQWLFARRWDEFGWLGGLGIVMVGAAFAVDPAWHWHFINGVMRRGDNPELRMRNMTLWAFPEHGVLWWFPLILFALAFALLAIVAWRNRTMRPHVLLALSLFIFPNGLNPVSSMMVLPFVQTRTEILILVAVSWLVAGFEIVFGGFGGFYLLIVFAALVLRIRRSQVETQ